MLELERRLDALEQKVNNIVRCGFVTAVDAAKGHVRVRLPEKGVVTPWLQVLQPVSNGGDGDYAMPRVDDQVAVLFIPVGLSRSVGVVLGSMYSLAQMPPVDDAGLRVIYGEEVRLGSSESETPVARGDKVHDLIQGILDLLQTASPVVTSVGNPMPLATDTAGTNSYGAGGITTVAALMAADLATMQSEKVKVD